MPKNDECVLGERIDWLREPPQTIFSTNVPGAFRRALLRPETRRQVDYLGGLSVLSGGAEFETVDQSGLYLVGDLPPEPLAA
jgi:hypothetical protein